MHRTVKTQVLRNTPRNLRLLANALKRGEPVGVPSETVYGLACIATDPVACERVFSAKRRPFNDPLIVHVHTLEQARALTVWNETADRLADHFWPGPLSLVLPKTALTPDIATAGLPSVAVRMPSHPIFLQLLKATDEPLAAPSANPFGYISPTCSEHVRRGLQGRIRYILEGGQCNAGLESTIVDLRIPGAAKILRPGAIPSESIALHLGALEFSGNDDPVSPSDELGAQPSPGTLLRHYSPRTPITLHHTLSEEFPSTHAVVFFQCPEGAAKSRPNEFHLTKNGNLAEAGKNLFTLLHDLDAKGWNRIHFQLAPTESGLGFTINDRLRRAARLD